MLSVWYNVSTTWVDILIYSSIAISLKRVVCTLPILQSDHLFIVSIIVSCSNPRRITASDITIPTEVSSTPLPIIHHSSRHFTSPSILQSYTVPTPITHTFHHIVSPEDIMWLSFELITTSFGSLLSLWPKGTVTYFRFETNLHHHRIASFFSKCTLPQYTTLYHLLYHFNFFKNICSSSHLETTTQCIHNDKNSKTLTSGLTTSVEWH